MAGEGVQANELGQLMNAPVSSHQAAKALDVTPQTISNWAKRGMAEVAGAGRSPAGHQLYDLDKLRAWAANNVGWVHGGKRKNAGRKPGIFAAAAQSAKEKKTAEAPRPLVPPTEIEDLDTLEDVDSMFRLAEEGKLPVSRVQALKALMDAKMKKQEYDVRAGVLMDSREWATELSRFLGALRNRIESMPGRMTQTLAQLTKNTAPEQIAAIRAALTAECDQWVRDVREFAQAKADKEGETDGTQEGN